MFRPLDLHTHGLERQPDRRPRFLDLQAYRFQPRIFQQQLFCKILRRALQQFICMLFQPHVNKCTDLSVMDGLRQIISPAGSSRIRIKLRRHNELLPQYILLRKYTVICKYFEIFDFYLIHVLHLRISSTPASCALPSYFSPRHALVQKRIFSALHRP